MLKFLVRRAITAVICVAGIAVVVFALTRVLPGDAAVLRAGQYATQDRIDEIRAQYGYDDPLLTQFGRYMERLVQLDLGTSTRTGQPVASELGSRIGATIELSAAAVVVAVALGLPLGVLAAVKGGGVDRVVRFGAVVSGSLASFWFGLVLIYFLSYKLGWFPTPTDRLPRGIAPPPEVTRLYTVDALLAGDLGLFVDVVRSLALPALTLGLLAAGQLTKMVRSAMVVALDSDFVRTARSLGVPRRQVIWVDALRNAALPILTTIGLLIGFLLGGNIIVERLFSWPGVGRYAFDAISNSDLDALCGFVLVIGSMYVALMFLVDIAYAIADPRVRLGGSS